MGIPSSGIRLAGSIPPTEAFLALLAAGLPGCGFWDAPLVVGVSGGADSVALLLGLVRLRPPAAGQLVIAHAEYDLREEAADDSRFVAGLADRFGLPFVSRPIAVRGVADPAGNEGLARRLRYEFLEATARACSARHVAVGHTADDQAETVLHRVLRGTGPAGLAGMRSARMLCDGVALVRPLLGLHRVTVRSFLENEGESWCEDRTNAETRIARNFLRHDVLGPAAKGHYPAAAAALARLSRQAASLADALESAAGHVLEMHSHRHGDGRVAIRVDRLVPLDPHLLAEVFASLWRREGWPRRQMAARHYARLAGLAAAWGRNDPDCPPAFDLPGGVRATRAGTGLIEIIPPRPPSGEPAVGDSR
jgi:tRNA(Ile)-lysidine synthase